MTQCERCGQADAVVTVTRIAMEDGRSASSSRHLCGACAQLEGAPGLASPSEAGSAGGERFRPLHAHALQLLARLEAMYEVTRSETFPAPHGRVIAHEDVMRGSALPPVLLTPRLPEAAPLAVLFTTQPGLFVHCGRWHEAGFGGGFSRDADASATAASEAARLDDLVGKVVDGLFAEAVHLPLIGTARLSVTFGDGTPRPGLNGEARRTMPRALARALIGNGPRAVRWRPWPPRLPAT